MMRYAARFGIGLVLLSPLLGGCGSSEDLDELADESDLIVRRAGDELRLAIVEDGADDVSTHFERTTCPTVNASLSVDGVITVPAMAQGGPTSTTHESWFGDGKSVTHSCQDIAFTAKTPPARTTTLVVRDGSASWTVEVEERRDETPIAIRREGAGEVRPGDEVVFTVEPLPDDVYEKTARLGFVELPMRWLGATRFAITMPDLETTRTDVFVTVSFRRRFTPHITRCDGPRACRFDGAVPQPEIAPSQASTSIPYRR